MIAAPSAVDHIPAEQAQATKENADEYRHVHTDTDAKCELQHPRRHGNKPVPAVEHDALRPSRYEKPVSRPQPFFGVTGRGMGRARQSARGTWSRAARTTTSTDSVALHNDSSTDGGGGGGGEGAKSAQSAFIAGDVRVFVLFLGQRKRGRG